MEAENQEGKSFEEFFDKILLDRLHHPKIQDLIDHLFHALLSFSETFHFEDDICLVGMEVKES